MVFGIFLYVCVLKCILSSWYHDKKSSKEARGRCLWWHHMPDISLGTKDTVGTTGAMLMRCDLGCKGGTYSVQSPEEQREGLWKPLGGGGEDGEGHPPCELFVDWTEISHAHGTRYRKAGVLGRETENGKAFPTQGRGSVIVLIAEYNTLLTLEGSNSLFSNHVSVIKFFLDKSSQLSPFILSQEQLANQQ